MAMKLLRVAATVGVVFVASVVGIGGIVLFVWSAEARADRVKHAHEHLVGAPASALVQEFRAPDVVELVTVVGWTAATGEIVSRDQPYVVWSHYPWQKVCPCFPLRVFVEDKTGKITRFKSPGD